MRLKKPRISIIFIIIIGLLSVRLVKLYIYKNLVESIADSTISSRYGDRYEINNNSRFNDALSNKREY